MEITITNEEAFIGLLFLIISVGVWLAGIIYNGWLYIWNRKIKNTTMDQDKMEKADLYSGSCLIYSIGSLLLLIFMLVYCYESFFKFCIKSLGGSM